MGAAETGHFRGSGGSVFELPLPLNENMAEQEARRQLVRVNEDGSPYEPVSDTADGSEETEDGPVRPGVNALKPEWVGYALAVDEDLTVDQADAMTKNDLIEKYGK